jgi:tripartite-type tricarboxylate transporter receptor subunit TctC
LLLLSAGAQAQQGQRLMTIIVPFPPGGGGDLSARSVAPGMSEALGVPIVVENISGATGVIGLRRAKAAAPDGTTLVYVNGVNTAYAAAHPTDEIDLRRQFQPVGMIGETNFALVVNPRLGVKSVQDLIAKAKVTRLSYGSAGVGSNHHFLGEMLKLEAGIDMTHIPYRGEALALNDVMAGQIDVAFAIAAKPFIENNQVVALGVTSPEPWFDLPGVRPLKEQGLKNFDYVSWNGFMAPMGTPPGIIAKLNQALNSALNSDRARAALSTIGVKVAGGPPDRMMALIARDQDLFLSIIKQQNLNFSQ